MLWQPSIYTQREARRVTMLHTSCPAVGFTAAGSADESKRPNLGTSREFRWQC
jgi:hypothetical protein